MASQQYESGFRDGYHKALRELQRKSKGGQLPLDQERRYQKAIKSLRREVRQLDKGVVR